MGVMQCLLYLLGQKRYLVSNTDSAGSFKDTVSLVVLGIDAKIKKFLSILYSHTTRIDSSVARVNMFWRQVKKMKTLLQLCRVRDDQLGIPSGSQSFFTNPCYTKCRRFNSLVTALLNCNTETGEAAIIANKNFDNTDIIESRPNNLNYSIKIAHTFRAISDLYFKFSPSILNRLRGAQRPDGAP
jgi:hypothetical protein